jgi:hypothetical protein
MRSSPSSLVVSRSEGGDPYPERVDPEKDHQYVLRMGKRRHRDDVEFNELDIKIKISYKTLLLVFVLFDVFHKIVNSLGDSEWVQGLIP